MGSAAEQSHRNIIGSAAQLSGPTIQARDVHGGIHLHSTEQPPPRPRQLLPVPANFTDRVSDLAALDRLLEQGSEPTALSLAPRPIVVNGPAGIGKTTLVSRWLHTLAPRFPDGQFYADLRGHSGNAPASPTEALAEFLRALAQTVPADPAERAALWRSCTADRRIAVMLDNAYSAAQIRPLLSGGAHNLVVVTSRRRLSGLRMDGAAFHGLRPLGPEAGVELLRRGIGEDRVANELSAVLRVVALCAGVPLAVCLASARLASRPRQPVAALATALDQEGNRLSALEIEGEGTVSKALDASYTVLSPEAALAYRRLGDLPMLSLDAATTAAACDESLPWAERRLDELVEANLLEDTGPDTCRLHDLVRVHAHERAALEDSATDRAEALRRVCDWYLHAASAAQELLTPIQFTLPRTYARPCELPVPFSDSVSALAWLDSRRTNLMAAVKAAAAHAWHDTAWQLVDAQWPLFLRLRHHELWTEAHAIGLEAARLAGNSAAERQMLNSGVIGLSTAGRNAEAAEWYTASLRAARAAGDVRDEGQAQLGLGASYYHSGKSELAREHLRLAITLWEGCGYPRGAALARTVLGEIALDGGEAAEAVDYFAQARAALLAVDDPHDAARALAFLGRARCRAGEYPTGSAQLHEALAVFTASGALHWQARTLDMLGQSARENGDAAAEALLEQAIALYQSTSPADARRLRQQLELPGGS
jgi:tetratricopeptide (TPR) repeat protein